MILYWAQVSELSRCNDSGLSTLRVCAFPGKSHRLYVRLILERYLDMGLLEVKCRWRYIDTVFDGPVASSMIGDCLFMVGLNGNPHFTAILTLSVGILSLGTNTLRSGRERLIVGGVSARLLWCLEALNILFRGFTCPRCLLESLRTVQVTRRSFQTLD